MVLVFGEQRRSALFTEEPRDPVPFGGQRPVRLCRTLRDRYIVLEYNQRMRGRASRYVLAIPSMT